MEAWHAALLGLVEGITEYLPISSTGHLILASSLLGLDRPEQRDALDAFEIVIQGGAILAVLGLYARRVAQMSRGLVGAIRPACASSCGSRSRSSPRRSWDSCCATRSANICSTRSRCSRPCSRAGSG